MKRFVLALLLVVLPGSAFALTSASQNADGGVTVRANVSAGSILDPGDRVTFQYQSAHDGAVVLFDIDTQGYVSVLNDEPSKVRAFQNATLPDDGSELFAEGEAGVEFVFAVAVSDPDAIDAEAIASLRDGSRRIDGDPFIAANMIAAEVVRNISQHTVFMGYTYFYVSDRVEYPCYLCGACDGSPSTACDGYRIVQNFDRGVGLTYPLERGYHMTNVAAKDDAADSAPDNVAIPDNQDEVNFYPYGSEVHYADPMAVNSWYDWGWYDPFLWYYPYSYPYCYSPWTFSVGFGWGWGGGYGCGGYYSCGYYDPWCGGGYYPGYSNPGYGNPVSVSKFKSQYKSTSAAPTLAQNRTWASKHDGDLRVASKGVRTKTTPTTYRSKASMAGKNGYAVGGHHVKTSVSGTRSVPRNAWAQGRNGTVYKSSPTNHSRSPSTYRGGTSGRTTMQRGGSSTRSKSGYAPSTRGGSSHTKGSWAPSSQRSAPRSSGYSSAPRMKSGGFAPASRGGGTMKGGGRGR